MKGIESNKDSQRDKTAQFEQLTGIAGGIIAFFAPSLVWLGYTSIPALLKEVTPLEQLTYIEVWLPLLVLLVAATLLGFGLARRRNMGCIIGTAVLYGMAVLGIAIWLFVFHPPVEWMW